MADDMSVLDTLLPYKEQQVVRSDSMDTRMFTELREQSGNLQKVEKLKDISAIDTGYMEFTV
jgi:hypothetical protein